MNHAPHPVDGWKSLLGACTLGTSGVLVFAILPLLLGSVADHLQLDDAQTGMVASLYFGAYFVITLTSVLWMRRVNWRWLAGGGILLLAAGLLFGAFNASYEGIVSGIALSGIGAAIVYALSVTLISDMDEKDRCYAIKLIPEQGIPALLLFVLPALVIAEFGLPGLLIALAVAVVALGLMAGAIPKQGRPHEPVAEDVAHRSGSLVFWGLGALLIFFAGFAGLWAFMERLAHESLEPELVGQLLALGLVSSAVGPVFSALLGDRLGRNLPIMAGVGLSLAAMGALFGPITALKYGLLMAVLPAAYYFALAYLFGIISDADLSGRYASLIASALALGAAVGPGLFGVILDGYGSQAGVLFVVAALVAGGALAVWVERRLQQAHLCSFEEPGVQLTEFP